MKRTLGLILFFAIAFSKGAALKIQNEWKQSCPEMDNRQFEWSDPNCEKPKIEYDLEALMEAFSIEQRYWSQQGSINPWWAVLTGFNHGKAIPTESKLEFYASGVDAVATMNSHLHKHNLTSGLKGRALDLGCGLGRMSNALAAMGFAEVFCVDQAESFLREAKASLAELAGQGVVLKDILERISFVNSGPDLGCKVKPGTLDFVHSIITLQHMKPQLQVAYIEQMCDALKAQGIGYLGIPVDWFATDMDKHCNLHHENYDMMMHYTPQEEIEKHLNYRGCSIVGIVDLDDVGAKSGVSKRFLFRKS